MTDLIPVRAPRSAVRRHLWLSDEARGMSIHAMGSRGGGKSRVTGRAIAWADLLRGVPIVLIDPFGPSIDNLLDKITRQPEEIQEVLWKRVRYINMSGQDGYVVPVPFYFRYGDESLYRVSQRFLALVKNLDPALQNAAIQGWNSLWPLGTYMGMAIAGLGLQISEAWDLIQNPDAWRPKIQEAVIEEPQLRPVAEFFDTYDYKAGRQAPHTNMLLTKTEMFRLDPLARAMFSADSSGIDWDQVVNERLAVLVDFRSEHEDPEQLRLKMLWVYLLFIGYVLSQGASRERLPISLIIDELPFLLSLQSSEGSLMEEHFHTLVMQVSRNYRLWLTVTHQELSQLSPRIQVDLMNMGTQIMAGTSEPETAEMLARRFYRYNPDWVHKTVPVWMGDRGGAYIVDYTTEEYSIEQQREMRAQQFMDARPFHFLVSTAEREGQRSSGVRPVSIAKLDAGEYVNESLVGEARRRLMHRDGRRVDDVLREIDQRRRVVDPPPVVTRKAPVNVR